MPQNSTVQAAFEQKITAPDTEISRAVMARWKGLEPPTFWFVAPQGPFTMRTLRSFCRFLRSFVRGYNAHFPFCALVYDPFRFCCGQNCGQYTMV